MLAKDTPMLRQYLSIKEEVPDCILFFRMGDFYEMFFEDAKVASKVLSIALTSRHKDQPDPIPMCGVPCRAVDAYLAKMVEAGFKVAVCDQVEDPKKAKGLVRREITRVASPGMFTDPNHLPAKDHRFLAALCLSTREAGLACLDLSSGEFQACTLLAGPPLNDELARLEPAELVLAESQMEHPLLSSLTPEAAALPRTAYSGKPPAASLALDILSERLPPGGEDWPGVALSAAAMAWSVVLATQRTRPEHVERLSLYRVDNHLVLDATARRNLELFRSIASGGRKGSLLHAVDMTVTAMGGRLLREWLGFPLLDLGGIEARHQAVDQLCQAPLTVSGLQELLNALPDVPRLVGRAALGQAGPRDLAGLREALFALPRIEQEMAELSAPLLVEQREALGGLDDLALELARTLVKEPPASLAEGGVIAPGVDAELDQQRGYRSQGKDWIAGLQASLRAQTGIPSLKVGFNKVFGYYLEVTKTHLDKVPENFIRKQTLANAERYITPELKEQEAAVLGAEERVLELERRIFEELRQKVAGQSRMLMTCARALAAVDVLAGLARLAVSRAYVRPQMSENGELNIKGGRHAVVEQMLKEGEFVPNDVRLDSEDQQVLIITGPNMAGKSTILRQVALIVLLAQAGSFVPADSAAIPLTDRIFTRVGAMDDLARGRSTFMVEMTETSQILSQATPRSLVILDEVGRGTSTFDGLSLAWAVAEHLHELNGTGVKTLFATHYHELTELAATLPRVKNFNVDVKEYQGGIVFLRRLVPGGVSRSYGLQVARLAGLPEEVLRRAQQILGSLENGGPAGTGRTQTLEEGCAQDQLSLFKTKERQHPILARLQDLDLQNLTPLQALNILDDLKRELS
ncbi:MAG: DNA mismatch repair protein MutS [Desulfarculaceae bacterium]